MGNTGTGGYGITVSTSPQTLAASIGSGLRSCNVYVANRAASGGNVLVTTGWTSQAGIAPGTSQVFGIPPGGSLVVETDTSTATVDWGLTVVQ